MDSIGWFQWCEIYDEKIRGWPLRPTALHAFNRCISTCSMNDIKCVGHTWSWSNISKRIMHIVAKLDKVLCNHTWLELLPHLFYPYLPTSTFIHSGILRHLKTVSISYLKPFRFFNCWALNPDLKTIVDSAWLASCYGVPQYWVSKKLKVLKSKITDWVRSVLDVPRFKVHEQHEEQELLMQQADVAMDSPTFQRLNEISK